MMAADSNRNASEKRCKPCMSQWYRIDIEALPLKLCYFFVYAKESCYIPYLTLYLTDVGLNISEAGIITGLRYIGMLLGGPMWGMVADRSKKHRLLYIFLCLISTLLMVPQPFIAAKLMPDSSACFKNSSLVNATSSLNDSSYFNTTIASVLGDKLNGSVSSSCPIDQPSGNYAQFIFHLLVNLLMMFFDGALLGLTDSAIMSAIKRSKKNVDFGCQRVFGAVGFACGTVLTSLFVDPFAKAVPSMSKYSPAFFIYAVSITFYCVVINIVCRSASAVPEIKKKKENPEHFKEFVKFLSKFHVLFFLITIYIAGVNIGLHIAFCFKLMEEMGASQMALALSIVFAAVSSIILFPFTTSFIKFMGGPISTICLSMFLYFVRFMVYGFASSVYAMLVVQFIHCLNFAAVVAAAVLHTKAISPKSIESTMYGLMNGLQFGAGVMTAGMFGGYVYGRFSGQILFRGQAIFSLVWTCFIVAYLVVDRRRPFVKQEEENDVPLNETAGQLLQDDATHPEESA